MVQKTPKQRSTPPPPPQKKMSDKTSTAFDLLLCKLFQRLRADSRTVADFIAKKTIILPVGTTRG